MTTSSTTSRCHLLLVALLAAAQLPLPTEAVRTLRFASPLTSLTIPDRFEAHDDDGAMNLLDTPRKRFLPKWLAGLKAEKEARTEVALNRSRQVSAAAVSGDDWAAKTAAEERQARNAEDKIVEAAFDRAVGAVEETEKALKKQAKAMMKQMPRNKYQFVGVVNRKKTAAPTKPITWYARKKPAKAKWSVRLVHVNQEAIIKDLFNRGKVDIFAKYENTGKRDEETRKPIVTSKYDVRERSWK